MSSSSSRDDVRVSRSSRRATLAPSQFMRSNSLSSRTEGSVSPHGALRARVLKEREGNATAAATDGSGVGSSAGMGKTGSSKPTGSKPAVGSKAQGSTRPSHNQQFQFAFGSRIVKPSKIGVLGAGQNQAADSRGGARLSSGPVAGDPSAAPARGRRDRSNSRSEVREAKDQNVPSVDNRRREPATSRENCETAALKKRLEEQETTIAALRSELGRERETATNGSAAGGEATSKEGAKHVEEWDDEDQAAFKLAADEARREVEETVAKVEAMAAEQLAHTCGIQASVDDMIRQLKAAQ